MRVVTDVHVTDPKSGRRVVIDAGDEVPPKYEDLVTNPKAFGQEPDDNDTDGDTDPGDVGEGPHEDRTVKQLRALAAANDVDLEGAKVKDDIVAALAASQVD